ncbi:FkbM family methyltransferase [Synechococcus elongatus]|uniref:FkbM family methyltransferase n=1 Tax=Synechococcus elongatus TaxID=32046 RepID=UPI0030CEB7E4
MTNYSKIIRPTFVKQLALEALNIRLVNALVTQSLRPFRQLGWRSRIPVKRAFSKLPLQRDLSIEMLDPSRCVIAREIWWHNGYLSSKADQNTLNLAISLAQDVDYFLDIGSYTGLFSLSIAKCNRQVKCLAYDIVPENFSLCFRNIIHNNLAHQVSISFKGIGSSKSLITVPRIPRKGSLPSSIAIDSHSCDGTVVEIDTLDSLIKFSGLKFLIKIDVEGFEDSVIRGGASLISECKPDIICEFLTRSKGLRYIGNFLKDNGYNFFRISNKTLVQSENIEPIKSERDWLLTTKNIEDVQTILDSFQEKNTYLNF